jgi:hypothetical protein
MVTVNSNRHSAPRPLTDEEKQRLINSAFKTLSGSTSELLYLSEILNRKGVENMAITDEASAREIVVKELERIREYS